MNMIERLLLAIQILTAPEPRTCRVTIDGGEVSKSQARHQQALADRLEPDQPAPAEPVQPTTPKGRYREGYRRIFGDITTRPS